MFTEASRRGARCGSFRWRGEIESGDKKRGRAPAQTQLGSVSPWRDETGRTTSFLLVLRSRWRDVESGRGREGPRRRDSIDEETRHAALRELPTHDETTLPDPAFEGALKEPRSLEGSWRAVRRSALRKFARAKGTGCGRSPLVPSLCLASRSETGRGGRAPVEGSCREELRSPNVPDEEESWEEPFPEALTHVIPDGERLSCRAHPIRGRVRAGASFYRMGVSVRRALGESGEEGSVRSPTLSIGATARGRPSIGPPIHRAARGGSQRANGAASGGCAP